MGPTGRQGQPLDQIRQLATGFVLTGFYKDRDPDHPLAKLLPAFIAAGAVRS